MDLERYLGEPVFCVNVRGRITRTAVSELSIPRHTTLRHNEKGGMDFGSLMSKMLDRNEYSLLNGDTGAHFFALDEAIVKAKELLHAYIARTDITKAEEQDARKYLAEIGTETWQGVMLSQPLIRSFKISIMADQPLDPSASFPAEYFRPGDEVFCLVTPATHYIMMPNWRPRPYFILQTSVITTAYSPGWPSNLTYKLKDTHYTILHGSLFGTEVEARDSMCPVFERETGGTILPEKVQVISVEQEKTFWEVQYRLMRDRTWKS